MLLHFFSPVTNKKPSHVSITKVKQFPGSSSFAKRSMWTIDQLRQPFHLGKSHIDTYCLGHACSLSLLLCFCISLYKDCPEFDLAFDNAFDQWVAGSAGEKCTFIQILHHTCQRYSSQSKPEFVNCQSKLLGGNSILHSAADSVTSAVQKASQALNERGERLSRAEEKTGEMKNSAEQFSVTAHKVTHTHTCHISDHYKGLGNFSSPHELNRSNVGPTVGIRYNIAKT
uniref:Syntaxin binding protein 6 (amisyn) n=1 Tax=Oncorhynchus tshawytscha TaxID=74940 RepID=A0AAZ3QK57_ONCTS